MQTVLAVVLLLGKGAYPQNSHVLFCHIKLAFRLTFYLFGSSFRLLADTLVLD